MQVQEGLGGKARFWAGFTVGRVLLARRSGPDPVPAQAGRERQDAPLDRDDVFTP